MEHLPIIIIGTGFSGLGMAIRLKQEGIEDFAVFERANEIGGTWRDNSYPGCACDVESHLYSFSFAPNPKWSRMWSPQPEILEYLKGCADKYKIREKVRFNQDFKGAEWDETSCCWTVHTSKGDFSCDILVSATGPLSEPSIPKLKGLENFKGTQFHSARWDHSYDLKGKKVAVIGTGASAIQFVPAIQPVVDTLHLFQRTAPWVVPYDNRALSEREHKYFEKHPWLQKFHRLRIYAFRELTGIGFRHPKLMGWLEGMSRRHLHRKVKDPALRTKLTPNFKIGCKRILISRLYYPALANKNVDVVTTPIREIRQHSIVTEDGQERAIDALIFGTGFTLFGLHLAENILGKQGESLMSRWRGSPKAYLGTTVSGFPNLFILFGPNTGLGHNSVILMVESQINHVLGAIQYMRKNQLKTVEAQAKRLDEFSEILDRKMGKTVWMTGCKSWYLDSSGRNSTLWPSSVGAFKRRVSRFHPTEYDCSR